MQHQSILVVDDDPAMLRLLKTNLEARGYVVFIASDGVEALNAIEMSAPDLVILDILMPKMDGREVCRRIREWSKAPIIMLSALGKTIDKTQCLDLGADDYITKPFAVEELLARIRSVMRRTESADGILTPSCFASGELSVDFVSRVVTLTNKEVGLTPIAYALLRELVLNADKTVTHAQLLGSVWGPEYVSEKEYLREYISHLRAKLESDPTHPKYIITVSGVGYKFRSSA